MKAEFRALPIFLAVFLATSACSGGKEDPPGKPRNDSGFSPIFNGRDLDGWHVSSETGHSRASNNTSGGRWVVEDGAIVGTQDTPGNGGIILSDRKFADFVVALESRNDFGPDSGLFLRSNDRGQAYQYLLDYYKGGSIAGLYGEGLTARFHLRNFEFLDSPEGIVEVTGEAPMSLPVSPAQWPDLWKHGQWNRLCASIVGNPPKITTWINGVKFMDWQDDQKRAADSGSIALQVHGGHDFTGQFVRYRNIRIKELVPGAASGAATAQQGDECANVD